jgi:hypothetical protein
MITVHIDDSCSRGKALLNYILTLDFVEVDHDDMVLTEEQSKILDERRRNHISGKSKSYSWDEVKNSLGKKRIA